MKERRRKRAHQPFLNGPVLSYQPVISILCHADGDRHDSRELKKANGKQFNEF